MDALRLSQKSLKSRITKSLKRAESSMLQEEFSESITSTHIQAALTAITEIKQNHQQLIAQKIANSESEQEIENYIDNFEVYIDETADYLAKVKDKLVSVTTNLQNNSTSQRGSQASERPTHMGFNLPTLSLPRFQDNSKDIFEFSLFKSSFEVALEPFKELSGAEKFLILRSNLYGRALNLIEHLPAENSSFEESMRLLNIEFYNKQQLMDVTIGKLVTHPNAKTLHDVEQLATTLRKFLVELSKLGLTFKVDEHEGPIISKIIRLKLPGFFSRELCRRCANSYPTYEDFLSKSQELVSMLTDSVKSPAATDKKACSTTAANINRAPERSNASTPRISLIYNSKENRKPVETAATQTPYCHFCDNKSHWSSNCDQHLTLSARRAKLVEQNKCSKCCKRGHKWKDCRMTFAACPYCQKRDHLRMLCPIKLTSGQSNTSE